jgi:hypothetical protein
MLPNSADVPNWLDNSLANSTLLPCKANALALSRFKSLFVNN